MTVRALFSMGVNVLGGIYVCLFVCLFVFGGHFSYNYHKLANYPVFPSTWLIIASLMIVLIKNHNDIFISYNVLTQMIDHFVVIARIELNSIPYSSH